MLKLPFLGRRYKQASAKDGPAVLGFNQLQWGKAKGLRRVTNTRSQRVIVQRRVTADDIGHGTKPATIIKRAIEKHRLAQKRIGRLTVRFSIIRL